MNRVANNWIAPANIRIPDFIICGAMKSGTSTVHYILDQHPQVYIPDPELHFFDIDNLLQHPDFSYFDGENWISQALDDDPEKFWNWYGSHFAAAQDDQIIGEDSTTYLASSVVARRIQIQDKKIKLLVLLRNPTSRAYSQYWHMVRSNRAIFSFENTVRFDPHSVLDRSLYLDQLKNLYAHIPSEQIKVVLFEDFLADKQAILTDICEFIGVDFDSIPEEAIESHRNIAKIPKYPALQLFKSKLLRESGNQTYLTFLPNTPKAKEDGRFVKFLESSHRRINPLIGGKPPKMNPETKRFLDNYFMRELCGINDILGKDVLSVWFK